MLGFPTIRCTGTRARVCIATLALAQLACRCVMGPLEDCPRGFECGPDLVCQAGLCVTMPAGCATLGHPATPSVTLGVLLPLTNRDGSPGQWGPSWLRAIRLAVDELNPPVRNGIRGLPITLLVCDTQSDSKLAAERARYFVQLGVQAILSDGSAETIAEAAVTVPSEVLLLSGASTSPEISDLPDRSASSGVGLVWRTTPSDVFQARVIAREIASRWGSPKVAVLERDDPYGQGLLNEFGRAYSPAPFQAFAYLPGADITGTLAAVAAYRPQVVVVIGFPNDVIAIVNGAGAVAELRTATWFFTQGAKFSTLFTSVREPQMLEGAFGSAPAAAPPDSPAALWFRPLYAQRYNESPESVVDLANVFDAAMLAALAAHRALAAGPLRGDQMALALARVSAADGGQVIPLDPPHFNAASSALDRGESINIEGASGALDFDNGVGEAPADIEVWRILDGGFSTLRIVKP